MPFDDAATADRNSPGSTPALIRQQMGHASAAMTARYTGEIPLEQIRSEFSSKFGTKTELLEKGKN
jgi:hypothetical protein